MLLYWRQLAPNQIPAFHFHLSDYLVKIKIEVGVSFVLFGHMYSYTH